MNNTQTVVHEGFKKQKMTESSNFKKIFNEISQSDVHVVGKVNFYNLTAHLEELYLQNQELKKRIEVLENETLSPPSWAN